MTLTERLQSKREQILRIAASYGASNVRVFGSVARGEAMPESDVDFLMEIDPDRSLLDVIGLIQDLEDLLGCEVDVAEPQCLHEAIWEQVLQEAVPL